MAFSAVNMESEVFLPHFAVEWKVLSVLKEYQNLRGAQISLKWHIKRECSRIIIGGWASTGKTGGRKGRNGGATCDSRSNSFIKVFDLITIWRRFLTPIFVPEEWSSKGLERVELEAVLNPEIACVVWDMVQGDFHEALKL